jgi:hypothetical protein
VVDRVFVHIGLPKTATTYLQTIIWANRDTLRERGVVVPGAERRDHLWASRTVREESRQDWAPQRQRTAWQRIRSELVAAEGTGLISHEFFAAARPAQVRAMVEALAPAEVHVVVTAREPLGLFTASWQESLKNGSTEPMADYGRSVSTRPSDIWNWRTLDLRLVLERWATAVPQERVHVLVLDPTAPREDVWHKLAATVGFSGDGVDLSSSFPNTSMGVVQAETLRRVNGRLHDFDRAFDRGVYIRTFLADDRLVPQGGDRFWPEPDQIEDCRARGVAAVAHLRAGGFDVRGDVAHLLVPDDLEPRRRPASVTDDEVAAVAVDLVATMLGDVRRLSREAKAARPGPPPGRLHSLRSLGAGARARWRRRVSRDGSGA